MSDPTTTNILLSIPTRGSDSGTWDLPVNGDFSALDGYLGGVQAISAASSPITLTSPSGAPTPSGGPTQAQNAVLRVTGTLTAGVQITLPLPGPIVIENLTTGNFVLSFRAIGSGQIIAVDQGEIQTIYNDGTNVRFVNLGGRIGETSIWAGLSAMPAWVTACTVPRPYLLCDGSIYNFSDYPYLAKRLLGAFGGNGITTFAVPDLGGRVPLIYDQTGTRITSAIAGINGQTIGAAGGSQGGNLAANQIPAGVPSSMVGTAQPRAPNSGFQIPMVNANVGTIGYAITGSAVSIPDAVSGASWTSDSALAVTGTATSTNASQAVVNNVQPAQVTGIAVIRAA